MAHQAVLAASHGSFLQSVRVQLTTSGWFYVASDLRSMHTAVFRGVHGTSRDIYEEGEWSQLDQPCYIDCALCRDLVRHVVTCHGRYYFGADRNGALSMR